MCPGNFSSPINLKQLQKATVSVENLTRDFAYRPCLDITMHKRTYSKQIDKAMSYEVDGPAARYS